MILFGQTNKTTISGKQFKNIQRKKKVLDLLYREDLLSATEISKRIGVSVPTSLAILKELDDSDYIVNKGFGSSKGGRRPAMFGLNEESILVVACELGRYSGKVGIFNSRNKQVAPIIKFQVTIDDEDLIEKVYTQITGLAEKFGIDLNRIYGIGLSMPGLVDEIQGINYTIKNKHLQNVAAALKKKFSERLIYVNNDARMQAYGEFIFGHARNHRNALIINWNWGLGLGMIIDGKLFNGSTGYAGELSHTKFVEDGELCICGKQGCLETVTSADVLIRQARNAVRERKISQLTARFEGREEELGVEDIIMAAKKGDEFSISLLNKVGQALGKALANVIQLLNPDIIVLGGVVSEANQYILTPVQHAIHKHCLEQISGNIRLVISEDWYEAGLLGVTAMLFQKIFNEKL